MKKLKILYITGNGMMDYEDAMIFHGLVSLGHEVTDTNREWYLEQGFTHDQYIAQYGRGFTMCNTLPNRENVDRSNIEERIRAHEFDVVIFGQIWRCTDYLNAVLETYNPNDVAYIDGEDHTGIAPWIMETQSLIFKRETPMSESFAFTRVVPIQFCIPESKVYTGPLTKKKALSSIIPWLPSSHRYEEEIDYYNEYRESWFAITMRKCGWDCMRHYEIIANGCLPYFSAYDSMPRNIMQFWPNALQSDANHLYREMIFTNANIDSDILARWVNKNHTRAEHLIESFHQVLLEKMTTKKMAEYLLNTMSRY